MLDPGDFAVRGGLLDVFPMGADAPLRIKPSLDPALIGWLLRFAKRCNAQDFRATAEVKAKLLLASRARLEQLVADEGLQCEFERSGTLYVYRDPASFAAAAGDAALLPELGMVCDTLDGDQVLALEPALNASVVGAHFHPGDARLRPSTYAAELVRVVRAAGGVREDGSVADPVDGAALAATLSGVAQGLRNTG